MLVTRHKILSVCMLVGVGLSLWLLSQFLSMSGAVVVEPQSVRVTKRDGVPNFETEILLRNRSSESIKILGIASSCQCVRIENNLKLVNSYATARIGISVAVEQFEVKQEVRVFTDHPDFPVIKISILPAR